MGVGGLRVIWSGAWDELTESQRAFLCAAVERAVGAPGVLGAGGEVRVRLVGDAEMAAAHERFAGIAGTTDVLTFDMRDQSAGTPAREGGGALDCDLLVCVDGARREAAERGHGVEREVLLYVVHGVLHCLGYDDGTEEARRAMYDAEVRVLSAIGVEDVRGGVRRGAGAGPGVRP